MDDRDIRDIHGRFIAGHKQLGGRKKGSFSLNDEIRKQLKKKDENGRTFLEVLAEKLVTRAMNGDSRIATELWQQIDGKPRQQIDIGSQDGSLLPYNITIQSTSEALNNKPKDESDDNSDEDSDK